MNLQLLIVTHQCVCLCATGRIFWLVHDRVKVVGSLFSLLSYLQLTLSHDDASSVSLVICCQPFFDLRHAHISCGPFQAKFVVFSRDCVWRSHHQLFFAVDGSIKNGMIGTWVFKANDPSWVDLRWKSSKDLSQQRVMQLWIMNYVNGESVDLRTYRKICWEALPFVECVQCWHNGCEEISYFSRRVS